jgi:hypothetical protein
MCRKLYMYIYMCAIFAVYRIRSDIMYIYADTLYITNNTRWKLMYIFIIGYILYPILYNGPVSHAAMHAVRTASQAWCRCTTLFVQRFSLQPGFSHAKAYEQCHRDTLTSRVYNMLSVLIGQ